MVVQSTVTIYIKFKILSSYLKAYLQRDHLQDGDNVKRGLFF